MKMKKLLAGVLSAAMVATMIPASMAFSSVSAEGEGNGLVASYDFTKGQTDGWKEYSVSGLGATYTEAETDIDVNENGLVMPAGAVNYSIANPLAGKVTDGFTVVVDVSIPKTQNQTIYEGLFGFSNHSTWWFMGVTNDGYTARANCEGSESGHHWYDIVAANNPEGGITNNPVDMSQTVRYVMTADENQMVLYVDGQEIMTYVDDGIPNATSYVGSTSVEFANEAQYFNFGEFMASGAWEWWGTAMTVKNVSFYNTAMTEDEVEAEYIASQLDLEVVGMQKGTINDASAIRFVANMDSNAVTENNSSIVNVGWAWEMKAATADWGEYQSAQVTTVTSDSSLTSETGKYAYTLVCESGSAEDYYSAVPYVVIEVNGNNYTFCYNGRGASYVSDASALVYAPADFAEVSTQA